MAKFIATEDGYVNLDHVVKLTLNHKGDRYAVYLDGDHRSTTARERDVERALCSIYPAAPGTTALAAWTYCEDGKWDVNFEEHAVIAWQSDEYGAVTPITATHPGLSRNEFWILPTANGKFWDLGDCDGGPRDSLDAVKEALIKDAKEAAERKAKPAA
jgi:hypothetical protein